ncbi:MAG: hypothetical protein HC904_16880 [Blastochloris sp.]|nr:hypothetical protein [Blastochloris sp.]
MCQPTKDRQAALRDLCREADMIVVVGGRDSNNTQQLLLTARALGCRAESVESAFELIPEWFVGVGKVGLTAGTSTLEITIDDVERRLINFSEKQQQQQRKEDHEGKKLGGVLSTKSGESIGAGVVCGPDGRSGTGEGTGPLLVPLSTG